MRRSRKREDIDPDNIILFWIVIFVIIFALTACSHEDAAWQAPEQPCNYKLSNDGQLTHGICVVDVELFNTIDVPRCIRCDASEIDPRKRSDRNDQEMMR